MIGGECVGCEGAEGRVGGLRTGNIHWTDSDRGTAKKGEERTEWGGHEGRKKRARSVSKDRRALVACVWVTRRWSVLVCLQSPSSEEVEKWIF